MDSRALNYRIGDYCDNVIAAPPTEGYGIEVEVEGLDMGTRLALVPAMRKVWDIKDDGSLRNSGAEFVSKFLPPDNVETAIHYLYAKSRKHWHPSERTGIHIHANMIGRTFGEVMRICTYYAMIEPLVFLWAGMEREENIFCVPWYRAPDEAMTVGRALERADTFGLRQSCKYSGLFSGPLRSFGTVEFRHAKTFDTPEQLIQWSRVVRTIANSYALPDPIELYSREGAAAVAKLVLGDLYASVGDDEGVEALLHDLGAVETAMLFQPSAHVFTGWGQPCQFDVGEGAPPNPMDLFRVELPRMRTAVFIENDDEDEEREDEDEDYDAYEPEPEPSDEEGEV